MKRIYFIILLLSVLFITGCSRENEYLVAGIALDGNETDGYTVTVETVSAEGSKIISKNGKTVLGTLRLALCDASDRLYFGHCKLAAVSREVAENGVEDLFELAFRDNDVRFSMDFVVADNCSARQLLESRTTAGKIASYEISKTAENQVEKVGICPRARIYEFIYRQDSCAPEFGLKNGETYLSGVSLFKNGRYCGRVDGETGVYITIASGEYKRGVVNLCIDCLGGLTPVEIVGSRTKIEKEDGKVTINFSAGVSLPEVPKRIYASDEETEREIEKALEKNLFLVVKDIIDRYGSDIFGFSEEDDDGDYLRTLKIYTEVSVKTEDFGLGTK